MKKALILTALFLPLFACSDDSGNSASSEDDGSTTATSTGIFVDGAVINIGYQTATQSGYTNDAGEFSYIEGETVTFNIGDLELPATAAKSTVTPLDIADAEDVNDTTVVNIIRLLQTLDQDGNPDNGITITESAHNTATTQVNFSLGEAEFAGSDAVTAFISNAGQDTPVTALVSTADAIAHFEGQLQAIGFSSLIAGSYQSQVDGDTFATEFVLNDDNTGSWSYQEEGGSITWSVSSDGVLTITFGTGEFKEYTLTSSHASNGTVSINFSNEPATTASWSKVFSIDMTQHTATSVITYNKCESAPLGWEYTFTATTMTLTGSDSWITPACTTGNEETLSENMQTMASDFDIPFNCVAYPVCTSADFNKQISGVDQDGRNFTSSFEFDRQSNQLTYIKSVPAESASWTEVITISRL